MSEAQALMQPPAARTCARWLGAAGGAGWLPAPGTWGSVLTVALLWLVTWLSWSLVLCAVVLALVSLVVGWMIYPRALHPDEKDPGWFVLDEVAGQSLCVALVPWSWQLLQPGEAIVPLLASLLAFRLFDIAKPWPVGALERLPSSAGVMLDDLAAGVLAAALCVPVALGGIP